MIGYKGYRRYRPNPAFYEQPLHEDLRDDVPEDIEEATEDDGEAQHVIYKECDRIAQERVDEQEEQQREIGYHRAMMQAIAAGQEPY